MIRGPRAGLLGRSHWTWGQKDGLHVGGPVCPGRSSVMNRRMSVTWFSLMFYKSITSRPHGRVHSIALAKVKYPEGSQWNRRWQVPGGNKPWRREKYWKERMDPNPTGPVPLACPDTKGERLQRLFCHQVSI